jgi:hypothetical protein
MYGRSGLVQQLETLRDDESVKGRLVTYLAFRAPGTSWVQRFRTAAQRYFADPTQVTLFGVLVRDVSPNALDLQNRATVLAERQPEATTIELRAKYLPRGAIAELTSVVQRLAADAGYS